ncbi:uncharacterized protein CIMG_00320 [Coccidioides immitis RS]|uniref:Uncharacterized protein n=1 Tax=Coccidioides immitis (strain RS) TaxID=246410 RepID=J3KGR2_COCIM|nr:uncharacterized protein CIMG_00320 [Coccidioides immitis RS]EAS34966.3 hypothetical protein CIMG_00320 [Coccidioides immitis RS]
MVGLKKFLSTEKSRDRLCSANSAELGCCASSRGEASPKLFFGSQHKACPPPLNMDNQSFLAIERQFEELHDHFRSRAEKRYQYIDPKPCPLRTKRHVDVIEAIFSSQRYHLSAPVSPLTLYNEDIAERNLHTPPTRAQDPYARVISAIYQEDVADRNILQNGGGVRCHPPQYSRRVRKSRSQFYDGKEDRTKPRSQSPSVSRRPFYEREKGGLRTSMSEHDLRNHSSTTTEKRIKSEEGLYESNGADLAMPSVPDVRSTFNNPASVDTKPAKIASNFLGDLQKMKANNQPNQLVTSCQLKSEAKTPSNKDHRPRNLIFPKPCTFSSRKNVRDLSINMELAAPRKMFVKVGTRPVESSSPRSQRNPSIDEIVNSPISVTSSKAPMLPKTASRKVEEIMNMFRQAYSSSQKTHCHPTSETLEDTIIREINCHDAFRRIHSDNSSEHLHESNNTENSLGRHQTKNFSRRGQYLMSSRRKESSKAADGSDAPRRELSIPALKEVESDTSYNCELRTRQRRHTYAQPPSRVIRNRGVKAGFQGTSASPSPQPCRSGYSNCKSPIENRPHSSHSRLSRAASAVSDGSDTSKWSIFPQSQNPKPGVMDKSLKIHGNDPIIVSEIQLGRTEPNRRYSALSDGSALSAGSSKSKGSSHSSSSWVESAPSKIAFPVVSGRDVDTISPE